jgi:hypothetical protein
VIAHLHVVVGGLGLHRFSVTADTLEDAMRRVCDWADDHGLPLRPERWADQDKVPRVDLDAYSRAYAMASADAEAETKR